ncbi:hypothetical protein Tco_0085477 [Tanacetum coccineum]
MHKVPASDCNADIKNVALSKNSANVCLSCNECLFYANHDACVVKYLKDVQKHKKAKSANQKVKSEWKPTGRIFKPVGESLSEAWTRFKDLLQKIPHHGIDLWLQVQIFYDHVNRITRRTIDQSASGKLRDRNAKESWALLEDLALYDNESWNHPRDFAKPIKAISLPQNVSSTSDRRLIKLENQVQRLMKSHLAPKQPIQVNKISSSCEICSGPHDTQYCMENPEQAFVEYVSSCTDETGGKCQSNLEGLVSNFMASQDTRLSKFEADFKQQQSKMTNKIDTVLKAFIDRITGALPSDTVKNPKLNVNSTSLVLSARSYPARYPQCSLILLIRSILSKPVPKRQTIPKKTSCKRSRKLEHDKLKNPSKP